MRESIVAMIHMLPTAAERERVAAYVHDVFTPGAALRKLEQCLDAAAYPRDGDDFDSDYAAEAVYEHQRAEEAYEQSLRDGRRPPSDVVPF